MSETETETQPQTRVWRVVIADDHPIVRRGIRQLIDDEPDMEVSGEADDARAAFDLVRRSDPDIVLADISLKSSSGLELVSLVRKHYPSIPCLVVSMHDEELYAERALRAGARGYVMKQDGDETIIRAVRKVIQGEVYASDAFNQRLLEGLAAGNPADFRNQLAELSERELEVFQAIGQGKTTRDIAEMLDVNVKTIETYRRRIKSKLGIANTSQLAFRAVEWTMNESG